MDICRSCRFWDEAPRAADNQERANQPKLGVCRRYPPVPVPAGTSFPVTTEVDGCGEHKRKGWLR